ncbi:beta-1,3-galactosyltransferase brn [Culicoides brevitarsis]|uniref:beta-1,3-galactosyltransferase brn n=1 Tax=Culicoides brevitarsis TaxID=469753 RepID=UPI00307B36C8
MHLNCMPKLRKILKFKNLICLTIILLLLNYFGAFTHLFERDFYSDFKYPMEGEVLKYARQLRNAKVPSVQPINNNYNFSLILNPDIKCLDGDRPLRPRLVILVKSALDHFENRHVIRQSWGYEKRFSDVIIRTVFLLGVPNTKEMTELSAKIKLEAEKYKDIVQGNFSDSYFNNTIKTIIGMKWAVTQCSYGKFYLFVDDDYYVSIKNVLLFIRNPINYPEYLEDAHEVMRRRLSSTHKYDRKYSYDILLNNGLLLNETSSRRHTRKVLEYELADEVRLFTGYVFTSSPHRHKSSKWYTPLSEYPWHLWPTYVTSGAYILSREALQDMYFCSFYTKHFRFDDIFLGLVAMKAHIEPLHSEQFYFNRAPYTSPHSYKYIIASHGYTKPKDMVNIWTQVRSAGYA